MVSYVHSFLKVAGMLFQVCGPTGAVRTASVMLPDLHVTKRSGFQRLQGDRVHPAIVAGWPAC